MANTVPVWKMTGGALLPRVVRADVPRRTMQTADRRQNSARHPPLPRGSESEQSGQRREIANRSQWLAADRQATPIDSRWPEL